MSKWINVPGVMGVMLLLQTMSQLSSKSNAIDPDSWEKSRDSYDFHPMLVIQLFPPNPRYAHLVGQARWTELTDEPSVSSKGVFVVSEVIHWNLPTPRPETPFEIPFQYTRFSSGNILPNSASLGSFARALPVESEDGQSQEGALRPFVVRLDDAGRVYALPLPSLDEEIIADLRHAAKLHGAGNREDEVRRLVASGAARHGFATRSLVLLWLPRVPALASNVEVMDFLLDITSSPNGWEAEQALKVLNRMLAATDAKVDSEKLNEALHRRLTALEQISEKRLIPSDQSFIPAFDAVMNLADSLPDDDSESIRARIGKFSKEILRPQIAEYAELSLEPDERIPQRTPQCETRFEEISAHKAKEFEELATRMEHWAGGE